MNRSNASTFAYSIIFCLLVACIIIYPSEAFSAALDGLKLWFNVVCPALLPFFICVEILIGLGIVSLFGSTFKPLMRPVFNVPGEGSFSFFMSISSGYPVGARITAKLRQEKLCTHIEGQRLLSLCSTSGPLFIIGAVATGIMNNPALGFFLTLSHYLSAVTIGFFMRYYGKEKMVFKSIRISNPITDMLNYSKKDGRPIGMLMGDAVKSGVNLILMIGGFIIFFSVITNMLKISGFLSWFSLKLSRVVPLDIVTPDIISSLFIGFMEVTNGARECASLQVPLIYKTTLVSFMIGFGGLSVNAQVMSIISETDLKFSIYMIFKLLQGIIAAIYSYMLVAWFSDLSVFNLNYSANGAMCNASVNNNWIHVFMNSTINLLLVLTFMLVVSLIKQKRPFKPSPFK
ncbi:MAG: sporulation integral membrane protein YlbJ [Clostridiaceae bacterium]|nr:sporulation integral membrane protein YlbJ [Clostridiaceae bacterium]